MNWQRASLIIAVLIVALIAWLGRYDIIGVPPGGEGSIGTAYRLDRWTGEVVFLWQNTAHAFELK